jgi:hypothetical protein
MAYGHYEGMSIEASAIRALFDRTKMLQSDWYRERLLVKQQRDIALWKRHEASLEAFRTHLHEIDPVINVRERAALIEREMQRVSHPAYIQELMGTIGADPFVGQGFPTTLTREPEASYA